MGPRRWTQHLARGLALGLITTIAVAWAGMYYPLLTRSKFHDPETAANSLRVHVPEGWTIRTWLERTGPWTDAQLVTECVWMGSTLGYSSGLGPQRIMDRVASGWPWPALEYSVKDDTNALQTPTPWEFGLPLPGYKLLGSPHLITNQPARLPVRPRWTLFLANVAVWSALWLLTITLFRAFLRRRRLKRSLCPHCAYPLSGAPACPECGFASTPSTPAPPASQPKLSP